MSTSHFLIIVILVLLLVVVALIRAWGKQRHQIAETMFEICPRDFPPNSNREEIAAAIVLLGLLAEDINANLGLDKDREIRETLDVVNIELVMLLDIVENTKGIVTP